MAKITLIFSDFPQIELIEVIFENNNSILTSKRGNNYKKSFHWSSAVKALVLLLLKFKLDNKSISGESGTLAASLDYALSKQPQWLVDMFGVTVSGDAYAKKIFHIINPERKRVGPVEIFLNPRILNRDEIIIKIRNQELKTNLCYQIIDSLENQIITSKLNEYLPKLIPAFDYEINYSLASDDIFTNNGIKKSLVRIRQNDIFNKYVQEKINLFSELDFINTRTMRLGFCDDNVIQDRVLKDKPISVYCTHALPGVHAIFNYLEEYKGYNFRLNFNIGSSIDTVKAIFMDNFLNPPDVVVVGLAASALLMSKKTNYIPLMLAPRGSHRIVASDKYKEETRLTGELGLMHDEAASALYHLTDLRNKKRLKRNVKISNIGLAQSFERLKAGDPDFSALLVFPHYRFNSIINGSRFLDISNYLNNKESLFFVSKEFASDHIKLKSLTLAIRESWRLLITNNILRSKITNNLLNNKNYQDILSVYTGVN